MDGVADLVESREPKVRFSIGVLVMVGKEMPILDLGEEVVALLRLRTVPTELMLKLPEDGLRGGFIGVVRRI